MNPTPKTTLRFAVFGALALFAVTMRGIGDTSASDDTIVQYLFVQSAEDFESDGQTLRLINVNQQTLYFSDRPARIAGHMTMDDYLDWWKVAAGPQNFADDPPNATLSVFEAGNAENSVLVVEISNPVIDGNDLVYSYTIIDGEMPASGGPTALFIDRIGVGGGVGPGYHGVGVGARGPGVR